jgi:anti-sigma B factor antagonist
MKLNSQIMGDMLVVQVDEPRIDAAGAIQFKERMREVTVDAAPRVVLDLSSVNFLDSSGLGAVVAVMKILLPGRKLELAGLTPTVEKVFRLTRMDSVFIIHPAVPGALRDVG